MTTYTNGQPALYGLYFATRPPDIRFVGADGEALDGSAETYVRVPTALALVLAPVLGAIFVAAFPLIIFVAVALGAMAKFNALADSRWAMSPKFQPAVSYLSGTEDTEEGVSPELDDLGVEVEERRKME